MPLNKQALFEALVLSLRHIEEWKYVEREIGIRLKKA